MKQAKQLTTMQKMNNFMDSKLIPIMAKIGNQRHLSSLRDGFGLLTPLIIAGAFGILMVTVIFGGWGAYGSSLLGLLDKWTGSPHSYAQGKATEIGTQIFAAINAGTLGSLSLYIPLAFGFFLAKSRNFDHPVMCGLVSFSSFIIAVQAKPSLFGTSGVFTAMVISILSAEIFMYFSRFKKLKLTMPEGVPPAIARSFLKLFPAIITAVITSLLLAVVLIPTNLAKAEGFKIIEDPAHKGSFITSYYEVNGGAGWNIGDAINIGLQGPFLTIASNTSANFGLAFLYVFLVGFFWFFGLHGTNIVNGIFVFWLPLLLKSIDNYKNGLDASVVGPDFPAFVGGTFDAFIFIGGTGATLPMLFMLLILRRKKAEVEVAKFALPAGVFQINEPVVFGIPLVVNPVYAIPYVFTMPILTISTWLAMDVFKAVPPVVVQIPWTLPIGLGALLATGFAYQAFFLALANFIIAALVWTPFILLSANLNNKRLKREGKPVEKVIKLTYDERLKLLAAEKKKISFYNLLNFLKKRWVPISLALFLSFLIIGLAATWGTTDAGIAMACIEGIMIASFVPLAFYGKFIWHGSRVLVTRAIHSVQTLIKK